MSNKVRYSINGQYFSDYGVSVAYSKGIADALKRKKVNSYDWAEYHGISVDLSKPKYEPREIELQCFIIGDNWEVLFANFNKLLRDEFARPGTQRLLIEPFGYKAMPYEVFMMDEIRVEKRFKEGKMVAVFTLRMIEPNPVKKVLYFTGDKLDLAYNCPSETEIFYGNGLKETAQGNVAIGGKTLAPRTVSRYPFHGRNYFTGNHSPGSWAANDIGTADAVALFPTWNGFGETIGVTAAAGKHPNVYCRRPLRLEQGKLYTLSLWVGQNSDNVPSTTIEVVVLGTYVFSKEVSYFNFQKFTARFKATSLDLPYITIRSLGSQNLYFTEIQVVEEAQELPFTLAPEEQRQIIIAGNVEEITNLTTNATVLWEKL